MHPSKKSLSKMRVHFKSQRTFINNTFFLNMPHLHHEWCLAIVEDGSIGIICMDRIQRLLLMFQSTHIVSAWENRVAFLFDLVHPFEEKWLIKIDFATSDSSTLLNRSNYPCDLSFSYPYNFPWQLPSKEKNILAVITPPNWKIGQQLN